MGRRRRVRPLKPSHFCAISQTRLLGEEGSVAYRIVISEKVGIAGAETTVHGSGEDEVIGSVTLVLLCDLA